MDIKQLRSFVEVVNCGSFTTAAEHLHISQPTVSMHLKMLEEEIGKPLVLRTAKRVDLASGGQKIYDQAASILTMHDRMLQAAEIRESKTIYIGASSIPSAYILPADIAAFREKNSDVKFVMHQDDSEAVVGGLLDGLFDIGFVGLCPEEDALSCVEFCADKIVLVTPSTSKYKRLASANLADIAKTLEQDHLIMRRAGSGTRMMMDRIFEQVGLSASQLDVVARLDDQEAIKNLIEYGFGVSLMSERAVADRVQDGRLLAFDIPQVDTKRSFYLMRCKSANLDDYTERFIAFMRFQHGLEL